MELYGTSAQHTGDVYRSSKRIRLDDLPEHIREPSPEHQAAASIIARGIRDRIARRVESEMLGRGFMWGNRVSEHAEKQLGQLAPAEPVTDLRRVSRENIRRLSQQRLSPEEHAFVANALETPFYGAHFTNGVPESRSGDLKLYSRMKLIKSHMTIAESQTEAFDLEHVGNDGYVFLTAEPGDEPKKPRSRFGNAIYRISLQDPRFASAVLSLRDYMKPENPPSVRTHLPGLSEPDYHALLQRPTDLNTRTQTLFYGRDMIKGLALSIVDDLRRISPTARETLLAYRDEHQLNHLIAGLYRNEVMVPNALYAKVGDFDRFETVPVDHIFQDLDDHAFFDIPIPKLADDPLPMMHLDPGHDLFMSIYDAPLGTS